MTGMPTKKVEIGDNTYVLTALKGRDGLEFLRVMGNKLSGFGSALALQSPEGLTQGIQDILAEDLEENFKLLVNFDLLTKNNEDVDIDIDFACKYDEMFELMWEAVKFNFGGFTRFTSIVQQKMELMRGANKESQPVNLLNNQEEKKSPEIPVRTKRPRQ